MSNLTSTTSVLLLLRDRRFLFLQALGLKKDENSIIEIGIPATSFSGPSIKNENEKDYEEGKS